MDSFIQKYLLQKEKHTVKHADSRERISVISILKSIFRVIVSTPLFLFKLGKTIVYRLSQLINVSLATFELISRMVSKQKAILINKLFWGRSSLYKNFFRMALAISLVGWFTSGFFGEIGLARSYSAETTLLAKQRDYDVELGAAVVPIDADRPRDSVQEYVIQGGDTLSSIAAKFDISIQTIKWSNGISSDYIKPGQVLKILPVTGVLHTVKKGDTLSSIASKYTASEQAIADVNWLDPPFTLSEGKELMIPGGVIKEVIAVRPTQTINTPSSPPVSGTGRFLWPTTGYISQYYSRWHKAIDIASKSAPTVYAADSGKVIYAGWDSSGYGLTILIDHGNGFVTRYAHSSSLYVKVGQYVNKGDAIMRMGSTGRSTGTHLHLEVIYNGVKQNPLAYF